MNNRNILIIIQVQFHLLKKSPELKLKNCSSLKLTQKSYTIFKNKQISY